MAVIGSHRGLPISFGTPGLVCSSAPHNSSTCPFTIQFLVPIIFCFIIILFLKPIIISVVLELFPYIVRPQRIENAMFFYR